MQKIENDLNKLVDEEDIQTVDSDVEEAEGNHNDSAVMFTKIQEKYNKISEVFENFVQEEYVQVYEHLSKEVAAGKACSKQVHMCLSGQKDQRMLEFYKDAYMQEHMNLNLRVDKLDVQELGIQLVQNNITYQYLKMVHHDETNHLRTIYLLGIQQDQSNKWLLSLDSQKLTD